MFEGTRCLGLDELVHEQRQKPFVMKCILVNKKFQNAESKGKISNLVVNTYMTYATVGAGFQTWWC